MGWRRSAGRGGRKFSRSASRVHRKNIQSGPMRGGIRL